MRIFNIIYKIILFFDISCYNISLISYKIIKLPNKIMHALYSHALLSQFIFDGDGKCNVQFSSTAQIIGGGEIYE